MISNELKMRVAQNCSGYVPRNNGFLSSMTQLSASCDNCKNFVRGKCTKNLFDEVKEEIRQN